MQVIDSCEAEVRPLAVRDVRITAAPVSAARLACVDLLRGLVMVIMALDHTREFFTSARFAPEDLAYTTGPLFFTRFITHFCAPVFFLLAGTSAYLSLAHGKSVAQVSKFLWTRGLWLVCLDLFIMTYAWTLRHGFWFSGVLWALGWSMVVMSLLVRLPLRWIAGFGAGMIVTHNLLDTLNPAIFGRFAWLWMIVRGHGGFWIVPRHSGFFVLFSVVPWVGVMAVGYAMGALLGRKHWQKNVAGLGVVLTVAFVVLRFFHLYGNGPYNLGGWGATGPWTTQANLTLTIISFFNTLKYPPSLQFLLMTLGPSLIVLALFDRINVKHWCGRILLVFGRVPLFYYVLHLYLLHALAICVAVALHQPFHWLILSGPMRQAPPLHYGHGLVFIYAMWISVVALLYVPCKWYAGLKQRHKDWEWLRYV